MPTVVVLTALPEEFQAVRDHVEDITEETHPAGTVYERGTFTAGKQSWTVAITQIGMGNARASLETERAITHFLPDVALFVGIAGGLKDVQLGGVVAATKIYEYESGKAATSFYARPESHSSSYRMEQRAKAVARNRQWQNRILPAPP